MDWHLVHHGTPVLQFFFYYIKTWGFPAAVASLSGLGPWSIVYSAPRASFWSVAKALECPAEADRVYDLLDRAPDVLRSLPMVEGRAIVLPFRPNRLRSDLFSPSFTCIPIIFIKVPVLKFLHVFGPEL